MDHSQDFPIRFDLPFSEAKQIWIDVFEAKYLAHIFEKNDGNIMRAARTIGMDRKNMRRLLRKHKITMFAPNKVQEKTSAPNTKETELNRLRKRFYEGINFKRGLIAYLHFDGVMTTREGVRQIGPILGGLRTCNSHSQYRNWNQLQILLKKIGILIPITRYCIYSWNDALVPILYKQALEKKRAGKSTEEILAVLFC